VSFACAAKRATAANAQFLTTPSVLVVCLRDQPCRGVQIRARLLRRSLLDLAQQFRRRFRQDLRPRTVPHLHDHSDTHVVLLWVWSVRPSASTGATVVVLFPPPLPSFGAPLRRAGVGRFRHKCKGSGLSWGSASSAFGTHEPEQLAARGFIRRS